MGVIHLSYLDLTPEQRQKAAAQARSRIQTYLTHPFLSAEQRKQLQDQLARINQWERGTLHIVNLTEKVSVKD